MVELDLATVKPSVAGPKRPQDRIGLGNLRREFFNAIQRPVAENGFGKSRQVFGKSVKVETAAKKKASIGTGSVVIAAITSCTNTSNPSVMLAAGLLAKKAVEKGLKVNPAVKASLAPGSRVVTDYLKKTGLHAVPQQASFQHRRLRLHDVHRQFRPARPGHRGRHRKERLRHRLACFPATAISRRACIRT